VNRNPELFPIVGIGASAGGIEALEGFFRGMPADPGAGFVVVTHLNPERESILHEIISRYTTMTVQIAADGAQVGRNCVYVLPSDAILSIRRGRLEIRKLEPNKRERKPIDIFLSALAKDVGEAAVAVVLSGGDSDGTLGTKAVKERGGLTLAQVPNGSGPAHPDMPESAISTGFVDFAIPADEMGTKIAQFARSLGMLETMAANVGEEDSESAVARARNEICAILRNQVGHDFIGYKPKTFTRRVQRRMQVLQIDTMDAYIECLRREPKEVRALFRDLLINVTNFFRDVDAFEKLNQTVIPKLFEGRGANDTVRVWVPGCATGEEVFSIAILMREHMDTLSALPRVQIFATDIDQHALSVARAARYPEALLDTVTPERRKRFFIPDGGSYVVSKDVRDLCIFSPHSVIRDPPFSRIDLVSCRNLLIYFGPDAQDQVIPIFHNSLKPGGYLFLGTSENVSQFAELFTPIEKKHRIFRSREGSVVPARVPMVLGGFRSPLASPDSSGRRSALHGVALRQAVETGPGALCARFRRRQPRRRGGLFLGTNGKVHRAGDRNSNAPVAHHGAQGIAPRPAQRASRSGGERAPGRARAFDGGRRRRPRPARDPDDRAGCRTRCRRSALHCALHRRRAEPEPRGRAQPPAPHGARRSHAARARATRHPRAAAITDRGIRDGAGGTQILQ
jgi:two-component system CheB/CheR fusion protein